jgi:hypothetical protein
VIWPKAHIEPARNPRAAKEHAAKEGDGWGTFGQGTRKGDIARERSGNRPDFKLQCKRWDGIPEEPTGVIWNDVLLLSGFNWQILLDSADVSPFLMETKGGMTAMCTKSIPVTCTNHHSIDELMSFTTKEKQNAFRRRFLEIRVSWTTFGPSKGLKWHVENKSK